MVNLLEITQALYEHGIRPAAIGLGRLAKYTFVTHGKTTIPTIIGAGIGYVVGDKIDQYFIPQYGPDYSGLIKPIATIAGAVGGVGFKRRYLD